MGINDKPCYKCTDRHPNCHDKCERYQKVRKELDRINEARRKRIKDEEYFYTHHK